ncbi:MAG: lysophospholipid acyltransferase family protein [Pseudomonadota bacterium]
MNEPQSARLAPSGAANRLWRVFGTGLSFVCFGLGAVLLGFTVWPILRLSTLDRSRGIARVQRAVSVSMRVFLWLMETLGVVSTEVHGRERLAQRGQFVIANHPTLIDVVILVGLMPEVDCIVKQALWRNVFLRWPVYWAGYISNATGEGLIAACVAALRDGRSLMVFPEGTRTKPGGSLDFQRGAAQIALAARVPLRPVTITCDPITLFKGNAWYRVPARKAHFVIAVGEPIPVADFLARGEPPSLAARHLTKALTDWFDVSAAQQLHEMRRETRLKG